MVAEPNNRGFAGKVWVLVRHFPATIFWLVAGVVLLCMEYPRETLFGVRSGLVLMVVLWAAVFGVSLLRWAPEYEAISVLLPRGDFRRWREFLEDSWQRLRGYRAAVDLGLVKEVPGQVTDRADRAKWLPDARLVHSFGEKVVLISVQERGALTGQILDRAEAFAPAMMSRPEWTRVSRPEADMVEVTWWHREPDDPLSEAIKYETHWANRSKKRWIDPMQPVAIGVREDGIEHLLRVFGRQILIVGSSGSGKGSLLWSVILQLAPAIREGTVKLYGIDLKGGVELSLGASLFAKLAVDYAGAIDLLEEVKGIVDERLAWMRWHGIRVFDTPTPEHPLVLVILDEAGSLVYQAPDTKTRNRADELLKAITSTGRAPGVAVIGALQDPRKESLASRDLFLDTLALRLKKGEVALALPAGAYEAGARADRIPATQPGTGFAVNNETGEVEKFRAFWVSDEVIEDVAATEMKTARKDAAGG